MLAIHRDSRLLRDLLGGGDADRRTARVEGDHPRPEVVEAAQPRLIERLISNVVDNAIAYNATNGWVEIITGTRGGHTFLAIANTGPIVPADEIDRLLQPFQRLDSARVHHSDGHGLGLSIAAAIATAHHADLTVRPNPGGGLDIELYFRSTRLGTPANSTALTTGTMA